MGRVAFPPTAAYFGFTPPRTVTVRSTGDGKLTVVAASDPTAWTTATHLDIPQNITDIASITIVNGTTNTEVPLSELESINTAVLSGQVGLLVRGYDQKSGAVLFETDSENSSLANNNDNQHFRGMRVVLRDLRFGQYLGDVDDYNAGTTYGLDVVGTLPRYIVFSNGTAYRSLSAGNVGNTPASSPSRWALFTFNSGDRIKYARNSVDYSFASLVDDNGDIPFPQDYSGAITFALGDKAQSGGQAFISLANNNRNNDPHVTPDWWRKWYPPKWTLNQYSAQIAYGTTRISYVFTYTLVNDWDEEGPPADPVSIDLDYGQTVSLHGFIDLGNSHYDSYRRGASGYRIRYYGFVTDSTGQGEYRLIRESNELGSSGFIGPFGTWVQTTPADWAEALSSTEYALPPSNPKAIAAGPNGMLMILTNDQLSVCEPFRGWAWPERYRKALPYAGVGLLDASGGWLATTKRYSYAISGPIPEQLHMEKLAIEQAGVSQAAMCSLGEAGIAYASNDGIVVVQGLGAIVATGVLFTRKEWRARYAPYLSIMRLGYHDGKLVCLFPGTAQGYGADIQGFVIRFDEGAPMYARLSVNGSGLGVDALNDQLLIATGLGLKEFETGPYLPLTWQSKEFRLDYNVNFGAIQVEYTGGPVGIDVYGDGVVRASRSFPYSSTRIVAQERLPSGYKSQVYSLYIYRASVPDWNAGTTYSIDDSVMAVGDLYAALQNGNRNHFPPNSPAYWKLAGEQIVHQVQIATTPMEFAQHGS